MTPEQIYKYLDKFISIYENGKEINPVPKDKKVTVYCKSISNEDDEGFVTDTTASEMGIELLIARSWIYQDELERLINEKNN